MSGSRHQVITGLGTVDAFGTGRESTAAGLTRGLPVLAEVDRSAGYHRRRRSMMASMVRAADLKTWLPPLQARRMSPPSRFAVAAARMAVADAAGTGPEASPADTPFGTGTAVVMATAYGAASVTERILRQLMLECPESISPALFTESVANAPAAQVALALGARAANITVTQREASPVIALGMAAGQVRRGTASTALAGAVEELNPLIHSILERFGALARPGPDGEERARPFDLDRTGFLAGEGATVVTLEDEDRARARSAPLLARVVLTPSAFDPTAGATGWGRGAASLARALEHALERAGIGLETIDRILSGAAGTRPGDRLEAQVLRALWRNRPLPPILVPKATTGEHGGGLLAAAVLATAGVPFGPTPGFERVDPELGIVPHDGQALAPPRRVLVTSLATGGAAAWAVLEAVQE